MSGEMTSIAGQGADGASGETLSQRVEIAFQEAVASRLNGKIPEKTLVKVNAREDGYCPILTFLIQDRYSGTKTTVEIPIGSANPEQNVYFAKIRGNKMVRPDEYREYSSPEQIGYEAAETFRRDYTNDIMPL
ncbi:MAG: hypothetical protein IIC69_00870 [Nanoarchaeota archaeon]|nr:hypothetical protein [Nanoarchaeota archaeon]